MTNKKHLFTWLAPYAMALASMLAADALAQAQAAPTSSVAVALAVDMRLWSFGDCDRRFPYVNTDAHKECVRVVGSPEARDARALRVCEVSHAADTEETERCKRAYLANKEKAAQETQAAKAPADAEPPPSPEVMRRVRAITTAAIEEGRAAAPSEERPHSPEPQPLTAEQPAPADSSVSTVGVVLLVAALAGLGVSVMRRKQAQSA